MVLNLICFQNWKMGFRNLECEMQSIYIMVYTNVSLHWLHLVIFVSYCRKSDEREDKVQKKSDESGRNSNRNRKVGLLYSLSVTERAKKQTHFEKRRRRKRRRRFTLLFVFSAFALFVLRILRTKMVALALGSLAVPITRGTFLRCGYAVADAASFPSFLPKEIERIKDPFAKKFAMRIQRLPVPVTSYALISSISQ